MIEFATQEWKHWIAFSDPSQKLVDVLEDSLRHPNAEWDAFHHEVIHSFDEDSDLFWINYAIKYTARAVNQAQAIADLEHILGNVERYAPLSGLLGSAARYLGMIANYPNETLAQVMQTPDTGDQEIDDVLSFTRPAALGAFVSTATDVEYGLNVSRQAKAHGRRPTLDEAERLIREWRNQHQ